MMLKKNYSGYAFFIVVVFVACLVEEMTTHLLSDIFFGFVSYLNENSVTAYTTSSTAVEKSTVVANMQLTKQKELDVLRQNGVTQRLKHLRLSSLTQQQLSLICHSYLDNANTICARKLRMGNIGDGGWEICDDAEVRPQPPCIIYSFGIGRDFSFDDEASRWYKCDVFSFDPTISLQNHNRSELVHFFNLGISGRSYTNKDGWRFSKLSDIRTMLGHDKVGLRIGIIKMDVEGAEWDSIPEMILSHEMSNVDQFLVEYHIHSLTRSNLIRYLAALQAMELAGFRIFYTHKNEACGYHVDGYPPVTSQCFEVHYRKVL